MEFITKHINLSFIITTVFCTVVFSSCEKTERSRYTNKPEITCNEAQTTILKDITYKKISGETINLDIYKPFDKKNSPNPVVVYVHGGRWDSGDKSSIKVPYRMALLNKLIENGYAVVCINYRLANSSNHFPAPISDCKDAVRWIRHNAEQYNFNPENIGLWGTSAGAHLAMLCAYTNDKEFPGTEKLRSYSSKVNYVIDNFGPTDINGLLRPELNRLSQLILKLYSEESYKTRKEKLRIFSEDEKKTKKACLIYSPITYAGKKTVPTLILQGEDDKLVPVKQSRSLRNTLVRQKVPCKLVIYPNAGHGFRNLSHKQIKNVVNTSWDFIQKYQSYGNRSVTKQVYNSFSSDSNSLSNATLNRERESEKLLTITATAYLLFPDI